mgnify:CR=1 FL=1
MENNDFRNQLELVLSAKQVWLLNFKDGMFAMHEGPDDIEYLPVWSNKEDAEKHCKDDWNGYQADTMNLGEFKSWLEELKDDDVRIAAFPDSDMQAYSLSADDFKKLVDS